MTASRLRRLLAGADTTGHGGLPASEVLAPLPLLALAVLVLNDRVLKGSAAPGWLTGKLSDVVGLFAFPLVVTAAVDVALYGLFRLGAPVDFTLRRWKLLAAIGPTAAAFAAMKLWAPASAWVAAALSRVAWPSRVVTDPTDLVALAALAATWWHGRATLARGAHGRLERARRLRARGRPPRPLFADAAACGAEPRVVDAVERAAAAWLAGGPAEPVDEALARLRG